MSHSCSKKHENCTPLVFAFECRRRRVVCQRKKRLSDLVINDAPNRSEKINQKRRDEKKRTLSAWSS